MNSLQLLFTLFEVLNNAFYPVVLDGPVSQHEVQLFAHPARFGSLGIGYPVGTASWAFSFSHEGTSVLLNTICGIMDFCLIAYLDHLARICQNVAGRHGVIVQSLLTSVLGSLSSEACSTIIRATDFQTFLGWLTVLPLVCHQFDLSPQQFHDAISLEYHRLLEMMLSSCDGRGSYLVYHMHWTVVSVAQLVNTTIK